MNKKLYPVLIILCLSSCYSYNDKSYQDHRYNSAPIAYKETEHSFFWGLQGKESPSKCKNNDNVLIESKNGFLNYFARIYTLGIYWPRTFIIECPK
ncbi:Bor family protein [Rickettsiales bacterium]|nr:Bor family protein [Rickettsiales bacterium]